MVDTLQIKSAPVGIRGFPYFSVHVITGDDDAVILGKRRYCRHSSSSTRLLGSVDAGALERGISGVDSGVTALTSGIAADFKVEIFLIDAPNARILMLSKTVKKCNREKVFFVLR